MFFSRPVFRPKNVRLKWGWRSSPRIRTRRKVSGWPILQGSSIFSSCGGVDISTPFLRGTLLLEPRHVLPCRRAQGQAMLALPSMPTIPCGDTRRRCSRLEKGSALDEQPSQCLVDSYCPMLHYARSFPRLRSFAFLISPCSGIWLCSSRLNGTPRSDYCGDELSINDDYRCSVHLSRNFTS